MKTLTWFCCRGHVEFAGDDDGVSQPFFFSTPRAVMPSPITLKNGFVSVNTETPIVPFEPTGADADVAGVGASGAGNVVFGIRPQPTSRESNIPVAVVRAGPHG